MIEHAHYPGCYENHLLKLACKGNFRLIYQDRDGRARIIFDSILVNGNRCVTWSHSCHRGEIAISFYTVAAYMKANKSKFTGIECGRFE